MKKENIVIFLIAVLAATSLASADLTNFGRTTGDEIGSPANTIYQIFSGNTNPFIFFEPSPETPSNNSLIGKGNFETNTTIEESSLEKVIYNFNKTNYTLYNDSLVGMWNFDNYTKFNDTSRYENDGSCSGSSCPTFNSSGKYNGAYEFDGSDDEIEVPDNPSLDLEDDFSISSWIYYDRDGIIFNKEEVYEAKVEGGKVEWAFRNNDPSWTWHNTGCSVTKKIWTKVDITYSSKAKIKTYINGNKCDEYDGSGNISTSNNPFHIGSRSDSIGPDVFNGIIDEVRIWNRSLSEEEVKQHYMSNLRKFNETRWKLEVNQTKNSASNLETGSYIYQSSAQGSAGYKNSTEKRTINIDRTPPFLEFTNPTPSDNKTQTDKNATINISSNEIESSLSNDSLAHSTFLDFNKSLVGWWEMDWSNETGIYDNSTYNNFGTFNGDLSQSNKTDGKRGKGLEFDGNDDGLDIDEKIGPDESFTVVAWVNSNELDGNHHRIITNSPNGFYNLRINRANDFEIELYDGAWQDATTSSNLSSNKWYHSAMTYSETKKEAKLYVNGLVNGTITDSNSEYQTKPNVDTVIGYNPEINAEYFDGSIDSVQIYDRSLSSEEVKALYNASKHQYQRKFDDLETGTYNYTGYSIDKFANVNSTEQRTLTVKNATPTINASFPPNDHTTNNRTPKFNWTASDPEGDTLTYELNITCSPGCSADDRFISGITQKDYVVSNYLGYLSDNGFSYNWSVRATDGNTYSNWTEERTLNVQSLIQAELPQNTTDFGSLGTGESKNTTNNNPQPLRIENTGNALINSSLNSTPLWQSVSHPSNNYQYQITQNESSSYSQSGTQTTWANVPSITTHAINDLNWTQQQDSADIELYASVPSQETAGDKQSTITITSSLSEEE